MIDKACLLWQELCGQRGFCFVYQNAAMSRYLLSAGLAYKVSWGGRGLGSPPPAGGPAAAPGAAAAAGVQSGVLARLRPSLGPW